MTRRHRPSTSGRTGRLAAGLRTAVLPALVLVAVLAVGAGATSDFVAGAAGPLGHLSGARDADPASAPAAAPTRASTGDATEQTHRPDPQLVSRGAVLRPAPPSTTSKPASKPASKKPGKAAAAKPKATKPAKPRGRVLPETSFGIWSFNVLGSLHTRGGKDGYAPGPRRARWALDLMNTSRGPEGRVDIVGAQEVENDQIAALTGPGSGWDSYPRPAGHFQSQAVLWRTAVFEMVTATSFEIPFLDWQRPQQVVLLRHRETGRLVWVVNNHLAPKRGRDSNFQDQRDIGTAALLDQVQRLRNNPVTAPPDTQGSDGTTTVLAPAGDTPVLVTGDMNQKDRTACPLVGVGFIPAQGGGWFDDGCRLGHTRIDQVLGADGTTFTHTWYDRSRAVARITDHHITRTRVTLAAVRLPATGGTR